MYRTKRLYAGLLAVLILTIAMAALAPHALAQGTSQRLELVGSIEAVGPGTITVNGLVIDVSGAEVETALTVGRLVKVEGFLFEDGALRAYEVEAADRDDDRDQFEMVGVVEAVAPGQMTIAGIIFNLANAEVTPGLVVGDQVKVHANRSTTGEWLAREVKRFVPGGDDSDDFDDNRDDRDDDQTSVSPVTGACMFEIEVSSANLHTGPGTGYDAQGYVLDDEKYPVTGVHSSGAWLQITTADSTQAWVAASVGELEGLCAGLAVSTVRFRGDDDGDDDRDEVQDDDRGDDRDDDRDDDSDDDWDDDHDDDRDDDDVDWDDDDDDDHDDDDDDDD